MAGETMQDYVQRNFSNISDGDLERTLPENSERTFTVAKCIAKGARWKTIRMHLELTEEDAETIEAESGIKHKIHKMLTIWRQRKGEDAKLRVLLDACYEAENKAAIDSICDSKDTIFGPPQASPQPPEIPLPVPTPPEPQPPPIHVETSPPPQPKPSRKAIIGSIVVLLVVGVLAFAVGMVAFMGGNLSLNDFDGFICIRGPAFSTFAIVTGVGLMMSGLNLMVIAVGWHEARKEWKDGNKRKFIAFYITPVSISVFCGLALLLAGVIGSTLAYGMPDACQNGIYAILILITTGWLLIFFYTLMFAILLSYCLCRQKMFDWLKKNGQCCASVLELSD